MTTSSVPFNGFVNGSSFTIRFAKNIGVDSVSGQITQDQILISVPQKDGTLTTITFKPGIASEYNTAVQSLQQRATATTTA